MLRISATQIAKLGEAAARPFEDAMVRHLLIFAPRHATVLGEEVLRHVIRRGIELARTYGLGLRGPTQFYIELMIMFGSSFDTDPLLPWTHYLRSWSNQDALRRAVQLHEKVGLYQRIVYGGSFEFEAAALQRLAATPPEQWLSIPDDEAWDRLHDIFPQKLDYAGEDNFALLLRHARGTIRRLDLQGVTGAAGPAGLMVAFGHNCVDDPQFSWIARTLAEPTPPKERLAMLARRTFAACRLTLANLEEPAGSA